MYVGVLRVQHNQQAQDDLPASGEEGGCWPAICWLMPLPHTYKSFTRYIHLALCVLSAPQHSIPQRSMPAAKRPDVHRSHASLVCKKMAWRWCAGGGRELLPPYRQSKVMGWDSAQVSFSGFVWQRKCNQKATVRYNICFGNSVPQHTLCMQGTCMTVNKQTN